MAKSQSTSVCDLWPSSGFCGSLLICGLVQLVRSICAPFRLHVAPYPLVSIAPAIVSGLIILHRNHSGSGTHTYTHSQGIQQGFPLSP